MGARGRQGGTAGPGEEDIKLNIMAIYFYHQFAMLIRQKRLKRKTIWLNKY